MLMVEVECEVLLLLWFEASEGMSIIVRPPDESGCEIVAVTAVEVVVEKADGGIAEGVLVLGGAAMEICVGKMDPSDVCVLIVGGVDLSPLVLEDIPARMLLAAASTASTDDESRDWWSW